MMRLLFLTLFIVSNLEGQVTYEYPDPLVFRYNFSTTFSEDGEVLLLFESSTENSFLICDTNFNVLGNYSYDPSNLWSAFPSSSFQNGKLRFFHNSKDGIYMRTYDLEEGKVQDSVFLGIDAEHVVISDNKIRFIREYPYLNSDRVVQDSVGVFEFDLDGRMKSSFSMKRKYDNIEGALWTTNTCFCDNNNLVLSPFSNEVISVNNGILINQWHLPNKRNQNWNQKMDSTFLAWGNTTTPGYIKRHLKEIMKWQKMSLEHFEQIYCDEGIVGLIRTESFTSEALFYTPKGTYLGKVSLDSNQTRPFLGRQVIVSKGRYYYIEILEEKDSLYYHISSQPSPKTFLSRPVLFYDLGFCEKCLDKSYSGIIFFDRSTRSVSNKLKRAELLESYPKSQPIALDFKNLSDYPKNKELNLNGVQLADLFRKANF